MLSRIVGFHLFAYLGSLAQIPTIVIRAVLTALQAVLIWLMDDSGQNRLLTRTLAITLIVNPLANTVARWALTLIFPSVSAVAVFIQGLPVLLVNVVFALLALYLFIKESEEIQGNQSA